jgi:Cu/Ag efflux protein CusF
MMMKTVVFMVLLSLAVVAPSIATAAEEGQGNLSVQDHWGPAHKLRGVVNSVNAGAGRVNITHDPVESLKWPKMKMNFKAHDAQLLKNLKPGMTVDFEIRKLGDEYLLTTIAPAP